MDLFGIGKWRLRREARRGLSKLLSTKVGDIMTDYVVTISPDKSAVDAASVMVGEDRSALVVEQDQRPIGILTERDFVNKVPLSSKVFSLKVKQFMSCSFAREKGKMCAVESVSPEATLKEAREALRKRRIRKLVVADKDGRAAGIITQTDFSKRVYEQVRAVPVISTPFLVKDIMSRKVTSATRKTSFSAAKQIMAKQGLSALPVMDGKEYVGIFTEYDVVTQFYDAGGKLDIKELPALMKSPIKAIPSDVNIFEANMIMIFEKVRRLLVIEEKKVVGIITQTDLVHACLDYCEKAVARLAEGDTGKLEMVELKRSNMITSEYVSDHIRAFTVR